MGQIISIALQILSFMITNKDAIKQLILQIEGLIPDAAGNDKAAAVKEFIGKAMGIEAQIEQVWPMIKPIFDLTVAAIKGPKQPV